MREDISIDFDNDLLRLVVLMQRNIPAKKLLLVARALPRLAEVMWADDPIIRVYPKPLSLSSSRSQLQPASTEPHRDGAESLANAVGNAQ